MPFWLGGFGTEGKGSLDHSNNQIFNFTRTQKILQTANSIARILASVLSVNSK